jgi:CBS domain-containing protein
MAGDHDWDENMTTDIRRRGPPGTISEPIAATLYDAEVALVQALFPVARSRLVMVANDAALIHAARLFRAGTDLVVVCRPDGVLVGVITKTDVISRISECGGAACLAAASSVMVRDVVFCHASDRLHDVWSRMKHFGLKNVPIIDAQGRPLGVLNARDALQVLLQEVKDEESLLRDYVMGVGYR